jgi:GT2 family glycosyltransferase
MPTICVCIVTFNSSADIADCLTAVDRQSIPIQSIIVVDNASTDQTIEVVKVCKTTSLIPIILIENQTNNGFAGGQNQAIEETNSDYVLVLNPDVRLQVDYIERLIHTLEINECAGSATGQLVFSHDPGMIDSAGLIMNFLRIAHDRGAGEPVDNWRETGEVFGVSGAASLYSQQMISDISLNGNFFDEEFFAYKEDVDVAWRAQRFGWKAYYNPEAIALHARGWKKGKRGEIPLFVRQHSYMNRFFTLIKNESFGIHLMLRLPAIFFYEILKIGYILLREPELLKCMPVFWGRIPSMIFKRSLIQKQAKSWNKKNSIKK